MMHPDDHRGASRMPSRRTAVAMLASLPMLATPAIAGDFASFLQALRPQAQAAGVHETTFDAVVAGLSPDNSLPRSSVGQPEFEKPLQSYYREAVSAGRIAQGRQLASTYAAALAAAEARYGVPGAIALAAWGMESDFGRSRGSRDVLRTLATLAWTRPDRPAFRDEFVAALVILDRGDVAREKLVGSWAGAMGDPQFLPSAYLKYAKSEAGSGAPDIWTNPADIIISIASFLHGEGWAPAQPWIEEVLLPPDYGFPTLHASSAAWAGQGVRRADGSAPTGEGDAALFLPSGAKGPAFLLYANYFAIKQYNNSDSYALSLGSLAQRIEGGPPLTTPWPARSVTLSRRDKMFIQARLSKDGLYSGPQDGKFGPKARDAIHAYQLRNGLTADGFATPALLASLRAR